jgi:hypothetical protein
MKETTGNLWEQDADAICITTNGFVKKNGACVMGRGCALEATRYCPGIEFSLGALILRYGNHVYELGRWRTFAPHDHPTQIFSFPTKHKWIEKSDIDLIERSAHELATHTYELGYERVVLPRPGCGNGQLSWDNVKPVLEKILDDRFVVITF